MADHAVISANVGSIRPIYTDELIAARVVRTQGTMSYPHPTSHTLSPENVANLVASIRRGDWFQAGELSGVVARVVRTGIANPDWAALVYFEGYRINATQATCVITHQGRFEALSGQMSRTVGCDYQHDPGYCVGPEETPRPRRTMTAADWAELEHEPGCW